MNVVYKGLTKLKNIYNQINPATLTGAIDIIVVEQEDGSLLASPFHVRFGKLGVLQTRERVVNISINGESVKGLQMKLGEQGEAFFVIEIDDCCNLPSSMITSPLPSRPSTPKKDSQASDEQTATNCVNDDSASSKRKRRKKRKRKLPTVSCDTQTTDSIDWSTPPPTQPFRDDTNLKTATSVVSGNTRTSSQSSNDDFLNIPEASYRRVQSDSELPLEKNFSPDTETQQRKVAWGWGQLPDDNVRDSSGDEIINKEITRTLAQDSKVDSSNPPSNPTTPAADESSSTLVPENADLETHFRSLSTSDLNTDENGGQLHEDQRPSESTTSKQTNKQQEIDSVDTKSSSKVQTSADKRQRNASEGLYLDDVLNLNPAQADLYLKVKSNQADSTAASVTSNDNKSRAASPVGAGSDVDSGTDCLNTEDITCNERRTDETFIAVSLCGFSSSNPTTADPEKFEEKQLRYERFSVNPMSYINDPNLVIRINDRYYNWLQAQPIIFALAVFKQTLPQECVENLQARPDSSCSSNNSSNAVATPPQAPPTTTSQQPQQSSRIMNWIMWRRRDKDENKSVSETDSVNDNHATEKDDAAKNEDEEMAVIMDPTDLSSSQLEETVVNSASSSTSTEQTNENINNDDPDDDGQTTCCGSKSMRKTTRLTSDELERLDLKEGANTITFSVTTQYQGTKRCTANIWKWKHYDKIVISDIDGTITKSDVFGQILPVMGKDWTQGGIAHLYHNINKNGYKFIYLSARAIGQASMTKDYLQWINQHGKTLPPGPLLLSPTSLISAFKREVIEKKPEKFKIECLKDIRALFPTNPFYAGFGNKTSDVISYTAVQVPDDRMFTINHRGELRQEKLPTYTTTLCDLSEVVDSFFPFINYGNSSSIHHSFSDFSYWRNELPPLTDKELDMISSTCSSLSS